MSLCSICEKSLEVESSFLMCSDIYYKLTLLNLMLDTDLKRNVIICSALAGPFNLLAFLF